MVAIAVQAVAAPYDFPLRESRLELVGFCPGLKRRNSGLKA
jgi:hypothetical protein